MADEVLELPTPVEWITITGRGDVALYGNGLFEYPRRLLNHMVRIDGTIYTVKGVEMYAVFDDHPANHWGSFGLLVGSVSK